MAPNRIFFDHGVIAMWTVRKHSDEKHDSNIYIYPGRLTEWFIYVHAMIICKKLSTLSL